MTPEEARLLRHDLTTPLTSLIGFLELLEDMPSVAGDPAASEYVGRCTVSAHRMLTLIDQRLRPPSR